MLESKGKDFWIISLAYAKSLFKNILDIKFSFVNRFSKFLRHILGLKECLIMIRLYLYEGESQRGEKPPSKRPRIQSRIYQLVIYSLLIPASTAVVERGFSLMNDICTHLRSRLTQSHLTCLMRITREGPEVLTDPILEELVEKFKNQKKRKLKL